MELRTVRRTHERISNHTGDRAGAVRRNTAGRCESEARRLDPRSLRGLHGPLRPQGTTALYPLQPGTAEHTERVPARVGDARSASSSRRSRTRASPPNVSWNWRASASKLWDLPPDQFAKLERQTRKPQTAMAFRSPVNGSVIEKQVLQGMHVMPGQTLLQDRQLSVVWVEANVYEQEVPFVPVGQPAIVTLDAYQGEQFHGRVIYIYPYVEEKTRTVKARLEFANRDGRLKPGMYANPRAARSGRHRSERPGQRRARFRQAANRLRRSGRRVLRATSRHDRSPPGRHGRNPQGLERRGRGRDGSHVLPRLREPA